MILILTSSSDIHADFVIAWLKKYEYSYIRLNADEIIGSGFYLGLVNNRICLKYKNTEIDIENINAVWYRKFGGFSKTKYFKSVTNKLPSSDLQQISSEFSAIIHALILVFNDKKWLTDPLYSGINKFDMLYAAKIIGLDIPETHIVTNKKQLIQIIDETKKSLITKSIYEPHFVQKKNGFFSMFTKEVTLSDLPDTFFPSLIQEKITKEYEVRSFYINGKFFSMAIFSQQNKTTELDFRKYDFTFPNRNVPYKLPNTVEIKIDKLLKVKKINCCSIDIIKSKEDGKYYFLEINPTGAFGMVSNPCNYELYKEIADNLINMDKIA